MAHAEPYDINALQINPGLVLDACKERVACAACGKKVKFFCYYCCAAVSGLEGRVPCIQLPFKLDVVKHVKELDGKSTALHAKIIAPDDVEIITYSTGCLDSVDAQRTALLFPGPDAVDIASMDSTRFDRVVVIDGTWSQAKGMVRDSSQLQQMQKVTIKPRQTRFWRYQSLDRSYLATIEAIYFLYRDSVGDKYDGEYDALMFFYKYFYDYIQSEYAATPGRQFTRKHQQGYIAYETVAPSPAPRSAGRDTGSKANYDFDDLELDGVFGE
ncbi:hypothetical protein GGF46_003035 [Coemansia sp. RSA 552]|nr:hypothetical protein GGF46_003035 [Coemansia sp. RSA 552]